MRVLVPSEPADLPPDRLDVTVIAGSGGGVPRWVNTRWERARTSSASSASLPASAAGGRTVDLRTSTFQDRSAAGGISTAIRASRV